MPDFQAQARYVRDMLAFSAQMEKTAEAIGYSRLIELVAFLNAYIECCSVAHDKGLDIIENTVPIERNISYMKEKIEHALSLTLTELRPKPTSTPTSIPTSEKPSEGWFRSARNYFGFYNQPGSD